MRFISRLSLRRHYNRSNESPQLGEIVKLYLLAKVSQKQKSVDAIPKENYESSQNCFQKNCCKICPRTANTVFSCTLPTSANCAKKEVILKKDSVL